MIVVNRKSSLSKFADYLLLLPSLIPLLLVFVYPFIKGILLTFHKKDETAWSLANYIRFFTQSDFYTTIYKTFLLVFPSSVLEMVVAFAMAYYLRKNIKGKAIISGLIIFPLTLGALIIAVGMVDFFKPAGWLNEGLLTMGIIHQPVHLLYNYWGAFIGLTILGISFMFSNLTGLMEGIDPSFEQAARTLGANDFTTFRKVFFPLIRSGVLTVFALNFIMQLAVFSTAILVGNPASTTRVMTVAAFDEAMKNFDYNMASTIAMIMALTQAISLGIIFFIRKLGYVGSASTFK